MGFAMLLSTLLIGYPLIFMPSYISEGSSFPKQLSSKDEQLYLSLLSDEKEGKNAKEMLIKHNMRLVAHIAKKYTLLLPFFGYSIHILFQLTYISAFLGNANRFFTLFFGISASIFHFNKFLKIRNIQIINIVNTQASACPTSAYAQHR